VLVNNTATGPQTRFHVRTSAEIEGGSAVSTWLACCYSAGSCCPANGGKVIYKRLDVPAGLAARQASGVESETLDAIHDHNEIRDAVAEAGGSLSIGSLKKA
jgi:hypothetical protein